MSLGRANARKAKEKNPPLGPGEQGEKIGKRLFFSFVVLAILKWQNADLGYLSFVNLYELLTNVK